MMSIEMSTSICLRLGPRGKEVYDFDRSRTVGIGVCRNLVQDVKERRFPNKELEQNCERILLIANSLYILTSNYVQMRK